MGFGFCLFVGCLGRLLFCVWLSSLVNPVTGKLSLPWLGLDSQDCHCRYDERSYQSKNQEVDSDDTYASTSSLIMLKFPLILTVAHSWHMLAGAHRLNIPTVELESNRSHVAAASASLGFERLKSDSNQTCTSILNDVATY